MASFAFVLLALASGLGLYFVGLAAALVLLAAVSPVILIYQAYTMVKQYVFAESTEGIEVSSTVNQVVARVLIIDDDIDVALSLEAMFRRLGCETDVLTNPDDVHHRMSMNNADFIVLDWLLSDGIKGSHVVERAIDVIDSISDLKYSFSQNRPRIVTYSALGPAEMKLPESEYFQYLEHWQKPILPRDLAGRASGLLEAHGF